MNNQANQVFKKGSTTYFNSAVFFPKTVRDDITTLYAFVREADNFIDQPQPDTNNYEAFKQDYFHKKGSNPIVKDFLRLENEKQFDKEWTQAFFASMEMDLHKSKYKDLTELLEYIYGSAEVIGLFIAKILSLPAASYPFAKMQGRAMQYINMIRDIREDWEQFQRIYLPQTHLQKFNLPDLDMGTANVNEQSYIDFMRYEIDIYHMWQAQAEEGYDFIPKRYRIAIKTAADMYKWTAAQLYENPFRAQEFTIKPSKSRVYLTGLINLMTTTVGIS